MGCVRAERRAALSPPMTQDEINNGRLICVSASRALHRRSSRSSGSGSCDSSSDFCECACHRRASFRFPSFDLQEQSLFTVIDERADCLCVRDRDDELHLAPAEGFDFGDGCWHPRFGDLRLTDATETLAEQRLDSLDPSTVVRNRDFLTEALPALGAGARRPRLPAGTRRSLEEYAADRLDFLRGREGERRPDSGGTIGGV